MTDSQFKENFRLNRTTYNELIRQIGPHLQREDTTFRLAIPVEKRVACALYLLGSTCELRTAANLFGIGRTTAGQILHEFCEVLVNNFFHRFIKFPTTSQEIQNTVNDFYIRCGYPMCIGSLDGTHIPIKPPTGFETDYFNYKKYHSVIMLAVVNSSLLFTYVNVGAPGRCNDSSVFSRSTLSDVIQMPIYANHYININNVKIQSHLIADSAFPLKPSVLKPYGEKPNMLRSERLFNYRLSRCRCSVERAFGSMKNRFRCLHKKLEYDINYVCTLIKATAVLHNLCVFNNDLIEIDWDIPQKVYRKPACNTQVPHTVGLREAMAVFFEQNPL
ncbi:unnamed protein product [Adineta ricciae]|uniref:DDE Tnp4 domain-containing protein n=1 Tax=Adineta ricciae TaxID=249248 RepID=A0A815TMF2_ADIRI|nr:unnamed protein product [Adineta ricciae]CAF1508055.1 unnamed protein product [Adineta ricciae]